MGEDDQNANAVKGYEILFNRMKKFGREKQMECLQFPSAGHYIDPPYTPQSLYGVYFPMYGLVGASGGKCVENSLACIQSWRDILKFLQKNTGIYNHSKL